VIEVGDVVEEIATNRIGEIVQLSTDTSSGQNVVTSCRVRFSDGKQPSEKTFTDTNELRVIPPADSEPCIVPDEPLA
jgi:hypothetical protein